MNEKRREHARRLLGGATPQPWITQSWGDFPPDGMPQDSLARSISAGDDEFILVAGDNCISDAALLVEAPVLLRDALDALEAAETRANAAERELDAAQRAAGDLAQALAYDSRTKRPDSLSYGMSCHAATQAAVAGGGQ